MTPEQKLKDIKNQAYTCKKRLKAFLIDSMLQSSYDFESVGGSGKYFFKDFYRCIEETGFIGNIIKCLSHEGGIRIAFDDFAVEILYCLNKEYETKKQLTPPVNTNFKVWALNIACIQFMKEIEEDLNKKHTIKELKKSTKFLKKV